MENILGRGNAVSKTGVGGCKEQNSTCEGKYIY